MQILVVKMRWTMKYPRQSPWYQQSDELPQEGENKGNARMGAG